MQKMCTMTSKRKDNDADKKSIERRKDANPPPTRQSFSIEEGKKAERGTAKSKLTAL